MKLIRIVFLAAAALCSANMVAAQNAPVAPPTDKCGVKPKPSSIKPAPSSSTPALTTVKPVPSSGAPLPTSPNQGGDADNTGDIVTLYVGTYSRDEGWVNGTGKGVHYFDFNTKDGSLKEKGHVVAGFNPTFVTGTSNKNKRVVYAINEVGDDSVEKAGTKTGWVYALGADASGALKILNKVESGDNGPAHVSISPKEDYVVVSNYGAGSVRIFPVKEDGSLGAATDFHQYPGAVVSHMHSTTWVGGDSTAVFAADLGNDRIAQFNLDAKSGKLVKNKAEFVTRPAKSGPRHMAIHPNKKFAYVVDETANTVGVYGLEKDSLSAQAAQSISTIPQGYAEKTFAADIHLTEDGKFLYASNRGHDSIAIFSVGANGQLTAVGHQPTEGKTPRAFHVFKNWLLVANQGTNNIVVFKIDPATGKLTKAQTGTCGTPVSLFIPHLH